MKKKFIILLVCVCMIGVVCACGTQETKEEGMTTEKVSTKEGMTTEKVSTKEDVTTEKAAEGKDTEISNDKMMASDVSDEKMLNEFYAQFYPGLSYEEIEERVIERTSYYQSSRYYETAIEYWENTRDVKDIANRIEPLFYTDMKYYTEEEFQNVPSKIIHLAKNEIYARRGYIFKDKDLNNYFMGCAWYQPKYNSKEFSDSVFNDYETYNLQLLSKLDK
ncbi:YARHG domain-containing protein [Anaerostipes faecalis]|uniref:YARHG domain-containing protein n=1 Tax=Anaerostipes faecalis TaxID=2738446 RepID=UPI001C1E6E07|nr:YARHG domain-containing protein [Anaerostipes faecalis]